MNVFADKIQNHSFERGIKMNRKLTFLISLFFIFIIVAHISSADIYSWVDENGVRHFSNSPVNLDDKTEISVQNEKQSFPNEKQKVIKKSLIEPDSEKQKQPKEKVPEKKYSPEELKKIDEECRSTWERMKEALKKGKIKD
jgi:hypothetical protein